MGEGLKRPVDHLQEQYTKKEMTVITMHTRINLYIKCDTDKTVLDDNCVVEGA